MDGKGTEDGDGAGMDGRPTTLFHAHAVPRPPDSRRTAVGGRFAGAGPRQPGHPPRESGPHRWRAAQPVPALGCPARPLRPRERQGRVDVQGESMTTLGAASCRPARQVRRHCRVSNAAELIRGILGGQGVAYGWAPGG